MEERLWVITTFLLAIALGLYITYAKKDKAAAINRLAYMDRLTGVSNLEKFEIDARKILRKNKDTEYAMVYLDIEKFKFLNESFGHTTGNRILIYFAKFFERQLRSDELFARVNGDKFVALLTYGEKFAFLERINVFLFKFNDILGHLLGKLRIIIVAGVYKLEFADANINIDFAIDRANLARKTVKGSHHNAVAFYDGKIDEQIRKEKEVENLMENALLDEEFVVYLQPKYNLAGRRLHGAEALVRWKRKEKKLIQPNDFIPIFERNGFIIELDFYILEKVFQLQQKWFNLGKKVHPIAVNISRLHVGKQFFIKRLNDLIKKYQIEPKNIEIEMTESAFVDNEIGYLEFISELRRIGFVLSMDDFGTGYSSLNLLREVPFDVLKLDRSFLASGSITPREKVLISNIVKMANELNIKVVSEGVETEEQALFLSEVNCDMVQGFLFSRPMPIVEFEELALCKI